MKTRRRQEGEEPVERALLDLLLPLADRLEGRGCAVDMADEGVTGSYLHRAGREFAAAVQQRDARRARCPGQAI